MAVQRIELFGVPVDIIPPQDMENTVMSMIEDGGYRQIVFLTIWDLLRACKKDSYAECLRHADLVIPLSKSILRGAKFLKKQVPVRYNPFKATISFLSILERHYKSLYILGGRKKSLMAAEANLRSTFKNLHIVGRYVGYYPKSVEGDVVQAIYKASPSMVLVSEGIKEKDRWSYTRRKSFAASIFLYYHDAVGIFSERITRVKDSIFDRGLEIWSELVHNPLKLFLIFPYMGYIIKLIWYRLFKKEK